MFVKLFAVKKEWPHLQLINSPLEFYSVSDGPWWGVFKDPPGNLTPTWDTPEAATAAEYYGNLITKYGPPGILSFTDSQSMQTQKNGRANIRTQAITWGVPLAKDPDSRVKDTVRYSIMPGGPAGNFPGSNSHGWYSSGL